MQKKVNFDMEEMIPEWIEDYPENKFAVYKTCFLSTKKNSHNLDISEDVLRKCANTILGNFLVAKIDGLDATTHLPDEIIYGYFPKEQEIKFEEIDGVVKAWAYCVISKIYGKEFNEIFSLQNLRNTSVEMTVELPEGQDDGEVMSFDIYGLTCLGLTVRGSCPDAEMFMVRFSEEEAEGFFKSTEKLSTLEKFVRERKKNTAEKQTEDAVINKFEENNKNLELEGKEEDAKLSKEIEFAAVDIGDMWAKVYSVLREHDGWRYGIEGIYEEDNKKFAVLKDEDGTLYRLDFSLTEEGMTAADELIEVQKEFIETDKIVRFAEPEDVEKYRNFAEYENDDDDDAKSKDEEDEEEDDGEEDVNAKMSRLESELAKAKNDIEERDNIIMDKDSELESLRAFKKSVEDKEKAMSVDALMAEVESYLSAEQVKSFREEGLACEFAGIDAWANKVKAKSFETAKQNKKETKTRNDVWSFGAPTEKQTNKATVWDRIRNL